MNKYIGRVFNADTGECVELLTVRALGHNHASSLIFAATDTQDNEVIDVKRFRESGSIKAPQLGV